jgi:RimJ/RimL family protein N-acetyltransferase
VASVPDYFLKSARLGFRCWSKDDLPLAIALWGDAKVTALIGGPFNARQVEERLIREIECLAIHKVQYWPIFLLSNGEHAGCAGLRPDCAGEQVYELGFHLRSEFWGRGLAEEAGRAVISHAFDALGAKALFAGHHPENRASRRVLEKLGFRMTHEELYPPTGLMHPSYWLERPHHLSM